ncbi:MAG: protein-glutamate O-methyltransferase CheR [Blastocatellia bacterium]
MPLSSADCDYICRLVLERSAIALDLKKQYLIEQRLEQVAQRQKLSSVAALVTELRRLPSYHLLYREVVEAMTTNETSFFRDQHPFEALRKNLLPELISLRAATRTLNLWCAASSSGQEPYSLVMLIREHFPELAAWTVNFIATDLSREMLDRARAGIFTQTEIGRGLPPSLLQKYFDRQGEQYQIRADLRRQVQFRELNLAEPWQTMPPMDLILMRNVLIYFTVEKKREIFARLRRQLRPDGYLMLGSAETTLNIDPAFERVQFDQAACYRLTT